MAAELQPPEGLTLTPNPPVSTVIAAPSTDPSLRNLPTTTTNPPKRQRRPSVRLGEIGGDPSYDLHVRRSNKPWRFHKDPSFAAKTSKTRPLTNLVNDGKAADGDSNFQEPMEPADDFTYRKPKNRRPIKRARTSWNNKFESSIVNSGGRRAGGEGGVVESSNFYQDNNQIDNEEFRGLEHEGSESPLLKEQQSPINSEDNIGLQFWDEQRKQNRVRVSESNDVLHNEANSLDKRNEAGLGIKEWLNGLGLRKYAPFFDIHEVDDEVLPLLTLEDLKDMGINAVGPRRKIYSAIQKLRKGFS